MQSLPITHQADGTLDGLGAGDRDQPYHFGRRLSSTAPYPFSTRQFAHLLMVRSRVQAGLMAMDDLQPA
jgi:hypothetical protein